MPTRCDRCKMNIHLLYFLIVFLSGTGLLCFPLQSFAQSNAVAILEKMPEDLETDFALSALPPQLRAAASVYLLDPSKGYYISRKGSNGFVCFISRTEWEWGEFRTDLAVPMSYDAEGAKTVFVVYQDVAAMRASGKFSAAQVRDSIVQGIKNGLYKAPAKSGISYMLAPLMRAYAANPDDKKIVTVSVPHYMFYAPYLTPGEIGVTPESQQSFILGNPGDDILGAGKGPFGVIICPVSAPLKMKIVMDAGLLIKRLAAYKSYFAIKAGTGHHS